MARQPIENLQGFGQTSVSSARPIDAFTGAPAIPQETPGSQLANALGVFGNSINRASARNAAQAEADNRDDQDKLVNEYIAQVEERYKIEKLQDIPSKIQLEKDGFLPEDSLLVMNRITEGLSKKYGKRWFASQVEGQRDENGELIEGQEGLANSVRYDRDSLNSWIDGKRQALRDIVGDKPFISSGALSGLNASAGELSNSASQQRKVRDVNLDKSNFADSVQDSFANASSPREAVKLVDLAFKEAKDFGTLSPAALKEHAVNEMVVIARRTYDLEVLDAIEAGGFGGGVTQKIIDKARQELPGLKLDKLKLDIEAEELANRQNFLDGRQKINAMVVNDDYEGLEKYEAELSNNADSTSIKLVTHIRSEKQNAKDIPAARGVIQLAEEEILTAHTFGDYSRVGGKSDSESIIEYIRELPGTTDEFRNQLIGKVASLEEGYNWINSPTSNNHYNQFFRLAAEDLIGNPLAKLVSMGNINMAGELRETYNNTLRLETERYYELNGNEKPNPDQIKEARKEAVEATTFKLNQLKALMDGINDNQDIIDYKKSQQVKQPEPKKQFNVGDILDDPETGKPIARVTGFDDAGKPLYEPVIVKETSPYQVTSEGDEIKGVNRRAKQNQVKRNRKAEQNVSNIFDENTATFNLNKETLSTLEKLVASRYERASKRKRGGSKAEVTEDSIMELVLDQLDVSGSSDFEYGGIFGDEADTAGEIAIKKIVDSLMGKYIGE
jgi:hypothetical protein